MSGRSNRFGFSGAGRSLSGADSEKIRQASIHEAMHIDEKLKRKQMAAFQHGTPLLTQMPEGGSFTIQEGDCVFTFGDSGRVLSTLNGLEAPFMEYASNPELVRALLESTIRPIGFAVQEQTLYEREPMIGVATSGTYSVGAPGQYNVKGQEDAHITLGCDVVMGVPNLRDPMQYGNRSSGVPGNAIKLQPRAADSRSAAVRAATTMGAILVDPKEYALAMREHQRVARATTNAAITLTESYQTGALMMIHQLIKAGVLSAGAALNQNGAAPADANEAVTRIAQGLGLVEASSFAQSRTIQEKRVWTQLAFDIKQAIFHLPHPKTGARNSKYEFGYMRAANGNGYTSIARSEDDPQHITRTPAGSLLKRQLTHFERALQSMTELTYEERRLVIGRANSTPSDQGTGIFQLQLQPGGSLARH